MSNDKIGQLMVEVKQLLEEANAEHSSKTARIGARDGATEGIKDSLLIPAVNALTDATEAIMDRIGTNNRTISRMRLGMYSGITIITLLVTLYGGMLLALTEDGCSFAGGNFYGQESRSFCEFP